MLTPLEKTVLRCVIKRCGERSTCLLSLSECNGLQTKGKRITQKKLGDVLDCLAFDGYVDVVLSDRRGERVYCITLLKRGKGYQRERVQSKREIVYRIIIAVASAVVTFSVGKLLYFIIN